MATKTKRPKRSARKAAAAGINPAARAPSAPTIVSRVRRPRREPPRDLNGYDPVATAKDHTFDWDRAEYVAHGFVEGYCQHVEGPLAGKPISLEDFQRDFYYTLFGWLKPDGHRRYEYAYYSTGRKQSKTTTIDVPIGIYMTGCDGQSAAANYVCALDEEQAGVLLRIAGLMVRRNPALARHFEYLPSQRRIVHPASDSFLAAMPAEEDEANAVNPFLFINDETHITKSSLLETMDTAMGARPGQMTLYTTTAGTDKSSEWYKLLTTARRVIAGSQVPEEKRRRSHKYLDDPAFLPLLYEVPEDADWRKKSSWKLANPLLGKTVSVAKLERECRQAIENPVKENRFRRFRCNQLVQQVTRYIPMHLWDACECKPKDWPNLDGKRCYGGFDLASKRDLTAFVLVWPVGELVYAKGWYFWPPGSAKQRQEEVQAPLAQWIRDKHLIASASEMNFTDYELVKDVIRQADKRYDLVEVGGDAHNATQLMNELEREGIAVIPISQTIAGLNEATKKAGELVGKNQLRHDGNPVLNWCASNVEVYIDPNGNIRPSKARRADSRDEDPTKKIDGFTALVNALARYVFAKPALASPYEHRDPYVF